MLTKTFELTRAQQKKLKIQAKWGSSLALMIWKAALSRLYYRKNRIAGYFQALQQEDSTFQGESVLPKAQDYRLMGLH